MELSRHTLVDFVRGAERQKHAIDDAYLQNREYGAFVTLYKKDELRGCVGKCVPDAPLFETVSEMTEAAASRDCRVEPIAPEELAQIHIDITVLSPLEWVKDPFDLDLGKHGLYIAAGARCGVLLPQVATQYRWDIKTFLEQTCLKAGLKTNAWQESNTRVSSFTALIIEEQL
jgi:AmmeMemoRadiSam system protein A